MKTGIILDERFLNHDPGPLHVESPERLRVIYQRLEEKDLKGRFRELFPRPAREEELSWNHDRDYIRRIAAIAGQSVDLDPDTRTSPGTWEAATLAVGALFVGIDALLNGHIKNGFALVRPPGHHAEAGRAMGFCIFNNVALGAHYALEARGLSRILIIDWDLHHGNGTQWSFYERDDVLYFSTHQFPYYPGSGSLKEVGRGKGEGYTVNIPLQAGCGDCEYVTIFREILLPIGRAFRPDLILVSAGFDPYYGDPLGGMMVTPVGFAYMTRLLMKLADEVCLGRLLLSLEGGYNLAGLRDSTVACLLELNGESIIPPERERELKDCSVSLAVLDEAKRLHQAYWPLD
ncbi:histone deacetylase family protein [Thermosulfuriphilus sp.]